MKDKLQIYAELLHGPVTEEEAIRAVADFKRDFPQVTKLLELMKKEKKEEN